MTTPQAMPTWEEFLLPVLQVLADGQTRGRREMSDLVATHVGLTEEQRSELLESGQPKADNRIGWALSGLARSGSIDRPRKGQYVINQRGRDLLQKHPTGLTDRILFPEGRVRRLTPSAPVEVEASASLDPVEQIELGINLLYAEVARQLLDRLRAQAPEFLEQAVLDLLVAMGYGGAEKQVRRLGGSGDGGVDGVIDQDALGLDRVYVQAKRYAVDRTIGRPDLQAFVGALSGKADGGVFMTTARFSREANAYADSVPARLILIDGARLTSLMIRYGVGVQVKSTYHVVEIDEDFFE